MLDGLLKVLQSIAAKLRWILQHKREQLWARLHRLLYSPGPNPKRIVVIGGSHGGYMAAKYLAGSIPSGYTITIVEKNKHLNHVFAFPRYSVYEGYEQNAFIPLDKWDSACVANGSLNHVISKCHGIIQGDAEKGVKSAVLLDNDKVLEYDFLVIATGAKWCPPVSICDTKEEGIMALKSEQKRIERAQSIAIIGAGAVGVELASDIKYKYGEDKNVVLYSSRDGVLPRFDPIVSEKAMPELIKMNVDLRTNCRPVVEGNNVISPGGVCEKFDLVYKCVGGKSNSDAFVEVLGEAIDIKSGAIRVRPTMQVDSDEFPNVFALGDVTDVGPKMARAAFMQAYVVRDNILQLIKNRPHQLRSYEVQPFENALNLTIGLDKNLLHFNGSTDVNTHEEDYTMMADRIWQCFDVSTQSFKFESDAQSV